VRFPQAAQVAASFTAQITISAKRAARVVRFQPFSGVSIKREEYCSAAAATREPIEEAGISATAVIFVISTSLRITIVRATILSHLRARFVGWNNSGRGGARCSCDVTYSAGTTERFIATHRRHNPLALCSTFREIPCLPCAVKKSRNPFLTNPFPAKPFPRFRFLPCDNESCISTTRNPFRLLLKTEHQQLRALFTALATSSLLFLLPPI